MRALSSRALALALLGAAACSTQRVAPPPAAPGPEPGEVVFDHAIGTWDWARGDSTCLGNRHRITFSEDRREMRLTHDEPLDSTSDERVTRYRVLAAGAGIHPDLPFVIRASMHGETRRTDSGGLVVWDLIMATPNRYHWHRTDWPNLGVTNAIVRCDGNQPLERWQSPATPPSRTSRRSDL